MYRVFWHHPWYGRHVLSLVLQGWPLTLTQKPRSRINEPASGSMMLHIYRRWTNHTLNAQGRCASRDEGVSCGARISWQHRFVAMMHLSGLTYLCEYSRAEECGKSRFKMSFDEAKNFSPNSSCFFFSMARLKGPWKLAGSHLPRSIILWLDYQPLLFCSGAIVSFTEERAFTSTDHWQIRHDWHPSCLWCWTKWTGQNQTHLGEQWRELGLNGMNFYVQRGRATSSKAKGNFMSIPINGSEVSYYL